MSRRDEGVTLIELIVAIAILGLIMLPLGNALISYLHNTDATIARLGQSHDAQISAAYFAQDVQSVGTHDTTTYPYPLKQSVETGVAYNGGLYPCGVAGTPDALVRFAWDDYTTPAAAATVVRAAYVVETVSGERQLHRIVCSGSSAPTADVIIAHKLASTGPTVTCSSTCSGTGSAVPQTVNLVLTLTDPKSTDANYVFTLTGQRRQT